MAEELNISASTDRRKRYQQLLPQLQALTSGEANLVANLANVAAALRQTFGFFWVGFYLVEGDQLVLGPFQGDIACTRIGLGRGVCGTAWQTGEAQWVRDVDAFPGHIVCSNAARSELVLPLIRDGVVLGVLDVDSDRLDDFEQSDLDGLHAICTWLVTLL
ncbi:GAF domain-containing protein [Reinekea sp.]|jgi:GAF domain-containing protein|uniref:GAF domain-containing protein n=1 Tax=Reinekea sp. TaxID=1970455 RepID=UPI002A7F4D25|nr:GAF domain-containing protein [Reinekea sp.]